MEKIKSILNKTKLFFSLILAFILVYFFAPKIFLANSPRLNPQFIAMIQNIPAQSSQMFASLAKTFFYKKEAADKSFASAPVVTPPADSIFKQVGKGVYAAEDKQNKKTYIMFEKDAKMKVTEYTLPNGQKITLYEPIK